jgi:hypothetical protein
VPADWATRLAWLSSFVLLGASVTDNGSTLFPNIGYLRNWPDIQYLSVAVTTSFVFLAGLLLSIVLLAANMSLFAKRAIFAFALVVGLIIAIRQAIILVLSHLISVGWLQNPLETDFGSLSVSIVLLIAALLLVGSSIAKLRENRNPPPDAVFSKQNRMIISVLTGIGGILFFLSIWSLGSSGQYSPLSHLFFHTGTQRSNTLWFALASIALVTIILSIALVRSSAASDLACGAIVALTLVIATYAEIVMRLQLSSYTVGTVSGLVAGLCMISAAVIALRSARHSVLPTQIPTGAPSPVAG